MPVGLTADEEAAENERIKEMETANFEMVGVTALTDAMALVAQEKQQRVERCRVRVAAVLTDERCSIAPSVLLTPGGPVIMRLDFRTDD